MPEKNDFPAEFYHMAGRECLRRAVREFDADPSQVPESLGWFMKCCDVIHPDNEQEFSDSTQSDSKSSDYSTALESDSSDNTAGSSSSDENSSEFDSTGQGWPTLSFGNVFDDLSTETGINLDDIDK